MEGARVEFDESFDERKGKPRAERVTGGEGRSVRGHREMRGRDRDGDALRRRTRDARP